MSMHRRVRARTARVRSAIAAGSYLGVSTAAFLLGCGPAPSPAPALERDTALRFVLTRPGRPRDTVWIDVAGGGGRMDAKLPAGRSVVGLAHVRATADSLSAGVTLPNGMDRLQLAHGGGRATGRLLSATDTFHFEGVVSTLGAATRDSLRAALAVAPLGAGTVSTDTSGESFSAVGADGRLLVFTRHRPDWSRHTLMATTLRDGRWTTPVPLPFSGHDNDREPALAPDGRTLWFSSDRPVPGMAPTLRGGQQIWRVERRADGTWGEPRHVPAPINVGASDMGPSLTRDGTLYFTSRRAGSLGRGDIHVASPDGAGGFHAPRNLGAPINSAQSEPNVFVSADGTLMLFAATDRPGGLGSDDIYVSRLIAGRWTAPRLVGPPVSSFEADYGPALSADGRYLYFTSHRRGTGDLYRVDARQALDAPPTARP